MVYYCVKRVLIRSYFPAFGLNTERYSRYLRIQSECGKIWTRIIPNTDTFYVVYKILEEEEFPIDYLKDAILKECKDGTGKKSSAGIKRMFSLVNIKRKVNARTVTY